MVPIHVRFGPSYLLSAYCIVIETIQHYSSNILRPNAYEVSWKFPPPKCGPTYDYAFPLFLFILEKHYLLIISNLYFNNNG